MLATRCTSPPALGPIAQLCFGNATTTSRLTTQSPPSAVATERTGSSRWRISPANAAAEPNATSTTARSKTHLFEVSPYSLIVLRIGLMSSVGGTNCSSSTSPAPATRPESPSDGNASAIGPRRFAGEVVMTSHVTSGT